MHNSNTIETLLTANALLTRIAARSTGSTTSSAVWSTLSVLSREGAYRVGDLAHAARITQPGMTKLLQNLVADEWVRRIADVADSRAWLIAITPTGEKALTDWRAELTTAMQPVFGDLSPDQWKVLEQAAQILSSHVADAAAAA